MKDKLLIVDDLERHDSSFEVTEILGYINNLCENDGVKVLLVGDENSLFGLNDGEKVADTNKYKLIKEKLSVIPCYLFLILKKQSGAC